MSDSETYRAKLVLEQVEHYTDGNNYRRERTDTIAEIVVTGANAAEAVYQMLCHVGDLQKWHATKQNSVDLA